MNTYELQPLMEHYVQPPTTFLGVFPRDKLPNLNTVPRPSCLIANTDVASEPGHHWVAFYLDTKTSEYFDSFADSPDFHGFQLTGLQPVLSLPVQDMMSTACGHHCVVFLYMRSRDHSVARIRALYSRRDLAANDAHVRNFVKKLQHHLHPPCSSAGYSQRCCARCECAHK